jgi:hypothetical protein
MPPAFRIEHRVGVRPIAHQSHWTALVSKPAEERSNIGLPPDIAQDHTADPQLGRASDLQNLAEGLSCGLSSLRERNRYSQFFSDDAVTVKQRVCGVPLGLRALGFSDYDTSEALKRIVRLRRSEFATPDQLFPFSNGALCQAELKMGNNCQLEPINRGPKNRGIRRIRVETQSAPVLAGFHPHSTGQRDRRLPGSEARAKAHELCRPGFEVCPYEVPHRTATALARVQSNRFSAHLLGNGLACGRAGHERRQVGNPARHTSDGRGTARHLQELSPGGSDGDDLQPAARGFAGIVQVQNAFAGFDTKQMPARTCRLNCKHIDVTGGHLKNVFVVAEKHRATRIERSPLQQADRHLALMPDQIVTGKLIRHSRVTSLA